MSIRVLIVDDSALMRRLLHARLARETDIEVVACASEAKEARQLIKTLNPDVVTLDIEMPGMDGLTFLQKIMELRPMPVIIVSGSTQEGAAATARALQFGAVSCYAKSNRYGELPAEDGGKLASLVREAATVQVKPIAAVKAPSAANRMGAADLIAVGSSTGGVEALHTLLSGFPADCPPTLIVQHVNACFAAAIAQSLDNSCAAKVSLAQSDIVLKRGNVFLAPGGDRHLLAAPSGPDNFRCILRGGKPVSGHQPSVDMLFESVAATYGPRAVGVLLTGMGQDGAAGLHKLHKTGARTIAQDEESCVVFGMPRAAIALGAASEVHGLDQISGQLFSQKELAA